MPIKTAALGIVRHLLTTGGGYLVANGAVTDAQVETFVGATLALLGIAWSVWDKKRREARP
jgi:hypothetical protein